MESQSTPAPALHHDKPTPTKSQPIPIPHTAPARLHLRKHIVIGYEGPDELYHDESEELSSVSSCDYVLVGSPPDIEDLGKWLKEGKHSTKKS
jgi:hypothetical protein